MAFDATLLNPIGGQSKKGKAPQVYAYGTSADNLATIKASGYFDTHSGLLSADDVMIVIASDGLFIGTIAAVTAGVVTMTANDINAA